MDLSTSSMQGNWPTNMSYCYCHVTVTMHTAIIRKTVSSMLGWAYWGLGQYTLIKGYACFFHKTSSIAILEEFCLPIISYIKGKSTDYGQGQNSHTHTHQLQTAISALAIGGEHCMALCGHWPVSYQLCWCHTYILPFWSCHC